jgi:hypothetical protein
MTTLPDVVACMASQSGALDGIFASSHQPAGNDGLLYGNPSLLTT